ncbi:Protein FAR1-RELATED SEQUENCE [Arachis hypogaea]|nr:Protein FAR1-RELATED SEQUENCE [Arachis hypogaea]
MHKFSEVLRHYRNNHLTADFETFYKFPVLTTCLESFEKQATELYTRNIFKLVKDDIEAAGALNVTKCPNSRDIVEYNTSEYFNQQWQFKVSYNKDKDLFACECRLFETRRLLCSHIFGILKHRNAKCVPTSLILKRWTRDAKSDFICSIAEQDSANDIVPTLRCGAMTSICWKLCDISSKNSADYRKISGELLKLISKVQNKSDAQARFSPMSALIGDPTVVKSKGAPKKVPKGQKRRRCSHCKSSRHFVRTCPLLVKEDSPAEYSNAEDEPMGGGSKKSVSKLTETPKIRANGKKSRQKTEEITLTQETLKDKTNTSGIEVAEVQDAATTKPRLPQYPMHHYPVVHPYQPYGGVLPIPFHPVPNGMAYFNQYPSTARITSYPQFSHVSSYSSGPSDSNTWARLLNDVINNKKP